MIDSILLASLVTAAGGSSLLLQAGNRYEIRTSQTAGSSMECEASHDWDHYLLTLSEVRGGPISTHRLARIRELWGVIERFDKQARYPFAAVTSSGGLVLAWDNGRHHFEIEAGNTGLYGWFYMDRESKERAGEEELYLGAYSPKMFDFLRKTIGGEKWS
jgi:hypothetical protein